MSKNIYPAIFEKASDDGYVVTFPDLPGCITEGDTIEEAFECAKEALSLHLDDIENKPARTAVENIRVLPNQILMLVEAADANNILYFKKSDVSKYIEDAIEQKGYSKYQVAQILNVDKSLITRITKGERNPSVDLAKRMGTLLDFDWRIFYAGT